jgi:hypothetical protein
MRRYRVSKRGEDTRARLYNSHCGEFVLARMEDVYVTLNYTVYVKMALLRAFTKRLRGTFLPNPQHIYA